MRGGIISVSLDADVFNAIKQYKAKGGNVSGLINNLLKQYFFGNLNNQQITKEIVRIIELEEKYRELEQFLKSAKEELQEIKSKLQEQQEIQEAEDDARLITLLKDIIFDDMDYLKQRHNKEEIKQFAEVRLSQFAIERKISLEKAWQLFYRAFPELEEDT